MIEWMKRGQLSNVCGTMNGVFLNFNPTRPRERCQMTNYISLISPDSAEMKFACHVFFLVEPKKQQIVI